MHRPSLKRATAVVAGFGLSTFGVLAMASPASAVPAAIPANLDPAPAATIVLRGDDVAVPDVSLKTTGDAVADDFIDLTIDCSSVAGATIGWSSAPTSSNNKVAPQAPTATCPGSTATNVLRLKFTGGVTSGGTIKLTGVKLDIPTGDGTLAKPGAAAGRIKIHVNAGGALDGPGTVAVVDRTAGTDRYLTASAIAAAATFDTGTQKSCAEHVTLVSGVNFPDALAASYLGFPVLLNDSSNTLSTATKDAFKSMGVGTVTIVGGTGAISSDVFSAIEALDKTKCGGAADTGKVNVDTRYGGGNRYDTARIVSTTGPVGTFDTNVTGACDAVKTAIVASGENYPDALAAGALAASTTKRACGNQKTIPIVLTEPGSLRTEAAEALGTIKPKSIIIVGGTTAISDATKTALAGIAGVDNVTRIAGTTRYETAAQLADVLTDPVLGNFGDRFFVASGGNFPDALAAGYWAGTVGGPILLAPTANLGTDASSRIKAADGAPAGTLTILRATLLGGTTALSNTVGADAGSAFTSRN